MSDPYLAQINLFGFYFPPRGYALCNGELVKINTNVALFSLLGTTFGGDGQSTFGYPEMRGRTPISYGTESTLTDSLVIGQWGGQEEVVLNLADMAVHTHPLESANNPATKPAPNTGRVLGVTSSVPLYASAIASFIEMSGASVTSAGSRGDQAEAHSNIQPTIAINFSICISGRYPSRS